eukprot:SAG31_NODE_129_length_23447_cov_5.010922_8_plen_75_part_00
MQSVRSHVVITLCHCVLNARRNGDGVITKQEMVEGLRNSGSVANGGVASLSDNRAKLRQLREQREAFEAKTNIR